MIIVPNCLVHVPSFFSKQTADELMKNLMKECRADFSPAGGKGRSMARYGATYTYMGRKLTIHPWRNVLNELREQVENACKEHSVPAAFNAAVLNLYKDEKSDLPMHADTKAIHQLGREPTIACVSFGASRPFVLAEKKTGTQRTLEISHGDLYIMHGVSQSDYLHGAPSVDRTLLPRVSVTFRAHR